MSMWSCETCGKDVIEVSITTSLKGWPESKGAASVLICRECGITPARLAHLGKHIEHVVASALG